MCQLSTVCGQRLTKIFDILTKNKKKRYKIYVIKKERVKMPGLFCQQLLSIFKAVQKSLDDLTAVAQ